MWLPSDHTWRAANLDPPILLAQHFLNWYGPSLEQEQCIYVFKTLCKFIGLPQWWAIISISKVRATARICVAVGDKPGVKKLLELYTDNMILSGKSSEMLSWEENGAASMKQQFIGAEQHVHILGSGCNSRRAFSLPHLLLLKTSGDWTGLISWGRLWCNCSLSPCKRYLISVYSLYPGYSPSLGFTRWSVRALFVVSLKHDWLDFE